MFHNLDVELVKARMTRSELAKSIGVTPTTLSLKLNGKSSISLKECIDIKKILRSELTIEDLFACDSSPRAG